MLMFTAFFAALALADAPPQHPFLSHSDASNMHGDGYASDTHAARGPQHANASVRSYRYGMLAGECAGITYDRAGRLFTVCAKALRSDLVVLDGNSLEELARFQIPRRKGTILNFLAGRYNAIFSDTSGGSYFYLDQLDRAVIATGNRHLIIVALSKNGARFTLQKVADHDLNHVVPHDCPAVPGSGPDRAGCDKVTTALPDYEGRVWFISRKGIVGVVEMATGAVRVVRIPGEQIQNSFAVAAEGVYIVSDHALYLMKADSTGRPFVLWREVYDRGSRIKPGQISQGSGTTPTVLSSGYVAITDNAEPRMHLLVYRRAVAPGQARLVCSVPLFAPGASATENSVVGFESSLLIENNYGYRHPFAKNAPAGGIARVDIGADGLGCEQVWQSAETSPSTVAKLSRTSRLLYLYTEHGESWHLTGVSFDTGRTEVDIPVGQGREFNNNWGAITLGPRDGEAFVGTFSGFVRVRD